MGMLLKHLLVDEGVRHLPIAIAGDTREDFSVSESATGKQFRFILPGPVLSQIEVRKCLDAVVARLRPGSFLVASGSLPPGVGDDFYAGLAHFCEANGVQMVLDTSGPALAACRGANLYLVKPSLSELAGLVGHDVEGEAAELAAACTVRSMGYARNVLVSLGERGALLVSDEGHRRIPAIPVAARSAVGAGDAMVGALVLALDRGRPLSQAIYYAAGAGAAALLAPGTQLVRASDVDRLYRSAHVGNDAA